MPTQERIIGLSSSAVGGHAITGSQAPQLKLSVILLAHRRREFLRSAVRSLLCQSLAKALFEVVVVKDFNDDLVDQLAKEHGWIEIQITPNTSVGQSYAQAIRKSTGEVLVFLDDDDLFEGDKLAIVRSAFASSPELVFFRDTPMPFAEGAQHGRLIGPRSPNGLLQVKGSTQRRAVRTILNRNLNGISSTISIRRKVVLPHLSSLEQMSGTTDVFLFYLALNTLQTLTFDPRPLTHYRLHASSSRVHAHDFDSHIGKLVSSLERMYENLLIISASLSECRTQTLVDGSAIGVKSVLYSLGSPGYRLSGQEFRDLLRYAMYRRSPALFVSVVMALVRRTLPIASGILSRLVFKLQFVEYPVG
nr:glycosyltransferase family A protein [Ferrimicrobium acidiphilum]